MLDTAAPPLCKVPATLKVAPEGTVTVSPEVPISKAVPDCGSSLSTNKVAILYYR